MSSAVSERKIKKCLPYNAVDEDIAEQRYFRSMRSRDSGKTLAPASGIEMYHCEDCACKRVCKYLNVCSCNDCGSSCLYVCRVSYESGFNVVFVLAR